MARPSVFVAILILLALSTLALVGCVQNSAGARAQNTSAADTLSNSTISFPDRNLTLSVEVANTPQSIESGLMNRTSLGEKRGMLFDMGRTSRQPFWMYHTKIPLDAVFLDEQMRVVDIQTMQPCAGENPQACVIYTPKADMRYVLEINAGAAQRYGIKEGDLARWG